MQSGNATLKKKIFIETSVLVAASNHITLSPGVEAEDPFYQESTELFSFITKYFQFRLGITSKTVETEAKKILMQAITSTLERNAPEQSQSFEAKSFHWNRCMERLEDYLRYLRIEPAPKEMTDSLEKEVREMYRLLTEKRKLDWQLRKEAREEIEAEIPQKPSLYKAHPTELERLKEEQIQLRYEHKMRYNMQLVRLNRKPASRDDRRILAEAVLIQRDYTAREPGTYLFIASCDFNNFSPYLNKEYGLSPTVTDEIQRRFQVRCERPRELTKMLKDDLEPPETTIDSEEAESTSETELEGNDTITENDK